MGEPRWIARAVDRLRIEALGAVHPLAAGAAPAPHQSYFALRGMVSSRVRSEPPPRRWVQLLELVHECASDSLAAGIDAAVPGIRLCIVEHNHMPILVDIDGYPALADPVLDRPQRPGPILAPEAICRCWTDRVDHDRSSPYRTRDAALAVHDIDRRTSIKKHRTPRRGRTESSSVRVTDEVRSCVHELGYSFVTFLCDAIASSPLRTGRRRPCTAALSPQTIPRPRKRHSLANPPR
ncbi:hypothetical protein DFR75_1216 [Nocardia ignorata]|uniref:Uncharacterized protein n=1 Tax=Nocardia ignorata TaxID=145285 RepID=A0A4R6NYR5_NOCIG|nr:hypothetical protein DFR75_1216 [Nocardia ignorata]